MTHTVTVVLTDAEYEELAAEAAKLGAEVEAIAHKRLAGKPLPSPDAGIGAVQEQLHRQGVVQQLPTGEDDTPEEDAEAERLAHLLGGGKPASEMVIEDRGPF